MLSVVNSVGFGMSPELLQCKKGLKPKGHGRPARVDTDSRLNRAHPSSSTRHSVPTLQHRVPTLQHRVPTLAPEKEKSPIDGEICEITMTRANAPTNS